MDININQSSTESKSTYVRVLFCILSLWLVSRPLLANMDLQQQRKTFLSAERAVKNGQMLQYQRSLSRLEGYPLTVYLEYEELKRNLDISRAQEIQEFIQVHADTPPADWLRARWLEYLAKNQHWDTFLRAYTPSNNQATNCYHRTALLELDYTNAAYHQIEDLWVVGHSQPEACDKLFTSWIHSDSFEQTLVWDRLFLVVANGRTSLAEYLQKLLPKDQHARVHTLIEAQRHPQQLLETQLSQPITNVIDAKIYAYAVIRLSRYQPELAADYWAKKSESLPLTPEDRFQVVREIALKYAYRDLEGASQRLSSIPEYYADEAVRLQRIRTALFENDWTLVYNWIDALPEEEQLEPRWLYWRARALHQLGHTHAAKSLYEKLVQERDYHSFLAADHLQVDYQLGDAPVRVSDSELDALARLPGLMRANELYQLGRTTGAFREWNLVISQLSGRQMIVAAKLAKQWGWHYSAIATAAKAQYWDDVELRFPIEFELEVTNEAKQAGISPAWAFGVMRQESAFNQYALSSAGALGLMQLMPYTGKSVASSLGEPITRNHQLMDIKRNIRYGIRYLATLLDRYDGQIALATAAYNAGPSRVDRWKSKLEQLPADIWLETQPFAETRKYVNNVLTYTIIYENRLGQLHGSLISEMLPHTKLDIADRAVSQSPPLSRESSVKAQLKLAKSEPEHDTQ